MVYNIVGKIEVLSRNFALVLLLLISSYYVITFELHENFVSASDAYQLVKISNLSDTRNLTADSTLPARPQPTTPTESTLPVRPQPTTPTESTPPAPPQPKPTTPAGYIDRGELIRRFAETGDKPQERPMPMIWE